MLKKIKNIALSLVLPLAMFAPLAFAPVASADLGVGDCGPNGTNSIVNNVGAGANNATTGSATCGGAASQSNTPSLTAIASRIVNVLSWLVGIVAVIMIIVGGFKYITSGGDSSKVGGAKNTLIYAIVGLVIVALAQFIVHFVLNAASTT